MKTNSEQKYIVYPYRWVVLIVYLISAMMIQLMWATFFSVTTDAWQFYHFADAAKGESAISLLSVIFMVGMIALSVPSMAAFEKWGFKRSVGFGVVLMGICGMLRGILGDHYIALLIMTVGFAVAQPFILNAPGLVAGRWFPESERATANSMGLLANYLGMGLALILSPILIDRGMTIRGILLLYGVCSVISAVLFLIFAREKPPTPPCSEENAERMDFREGFRTAVHRKNFKTCVILFFFLFGTFNVFFTLIEPIMHTMSHGAVDATRAGVIGVIILIVGIIGSVVIAMVSDKDPRHRRVPYMAAANIVGTVGLLMFLLLHSYVGMVVAGVLYGGFTIGSAPVLLTLAAEEAYPTSEGTSEGMMMWIGNIGGVVLIGAANLMGGNHSLLMIVMVVLSAICTLRMFMIHETKLKDSALDKARGEAALQK